jgi:hypothetical protein
MESGGTSASPADGAGCVVFADRAEERETNAVATAETHLRYAEGHLQPAEEHLADAEVHLKLVKAHLAALVAMEPVGANPPVAAALPLPEPAGGEASASRAEMTPEERDRSPAARPGVRSAQRGGEPGNKTPGFRRHHLLRLVSQTRANQARDGGRRQLQSQGETSQAGRNVPHGCNTVLLFLG